MTDLMPLLCRGACRMTGLLITLKNLGVLAETGQTSKGETVRIGAQQQELYPLLARAHQCTRE